MILVDHPQGSLESDSARRDHFERAPSHLVGDDFRGEDTRAKPRFGQPFYLESDGERVTGEVLKQMTDEAMYQLAALLPPEQRGIYADLDRATAKYVRHVA